jgi:hypothetical protein
LRKPSSRTSKPQYVHSLGLTSKVRRKRRSLTRQEDLPTSKVKQMRVWKFPRTKSRQR